MKHSLFLYSRLVLIAWLSLGLALACHAKQLVILDEHALAQTKKQIVSGESTDTTLFAYRATLKKANKALAAEPLSVVHKKIIPFSNDIHDYISISRYWWPDETKDDGLPWIRKDGQTNPDTQTDSVDRKRLGRMAAHVHLLALAYYFTDDEKYAEKAALLLRTWFLDKSTKMNPNLNYAQSVPGIAAMRRSGILDGRVISLKVLDAIVLIQASKHWSKKDKQGMNAWLNQYLTWLTTSTLGKKGAQQQNNHGSWYYFQVAALSSFLEHNNTLQKALGQSKALIRSQFDKQGAQHEELVRTRSYSYSIFNLSALSNLARVANKHGDNLWYYPNKETSILALGVEYLIPVANGHKWPHPESKLIPSDIKGILAEYIEHYPTKANIDLYNDLIEELKDKNNSTNDLLLLLIENNKHF